MSRSDKSCGQNEDSGPYLRGTPQGGDSSVQQLGPSGSPGEWAAPAHSQATQLPGSERRTGAPPLPGRGRGVRRGRADPAPVGKGANLAPPVPVPVRPAPLPDTH